MSSTKRWPQLALGFFCFIFYFILLSDFLTFFFFFDVVPIDFAIRVMEDCWLGRLFVGFSEHNIKEKEKIQTVKKQKREREREGLFVE